MLTCGCYVGSPWTRGRATWPGIPYRQRWVVPYRVGTSDRCGGMKTSDTDTGAGRATPRCCFNGWSLPAAMFTLVVMFTLSGVCQKCARDCGLHRVGIHKLVLSQERCNVLGDGERLVPAVVLDLRSLNHMAMRSKMASALMPDSHQYGSDAVYIPPVAHNAFT